MVPGTRYIAVCVVYGDVAKFSDEDDDGYCRQKDRSGCHSSS